MPLPAEFYKAVDAITNFNDESVIYLDNGVMRSHTQDGEGASYEVEGLPGNLAFNPKYLKFIQPSFVNVFFDSENGEALFFNENVRGIIKGIRR
jgi:hypothetical protein